MSEHFPYINSDYLGNNFQLDQLKLSFYERNKTEGQHFSSEILFIFVTGGQGKIEINNHFFDLAAGDLLQLLPYQVHRLIFTTGQKLQFYQLSFPLPLLFLAAPQLKTYLTALKKLDQVFPVVILTKRSCQQLSFYCETYLIEKNRTTDGLKTALITFFVYSYFRNQSLTLKTENKNGLAFLCLNYLQFHYQLKLTPSMVAQALGIKEIEVKTLVKKMAGLTFSQLLQRIRISNAQALLQYPEFSIQEICQLSGYQTEVTFFKHFKAVVGTSPQQQRKKKPLPLTKSDPWSISTYMLANCRRKDLKETLLDQINLPLLEVDQRIYQTFGETFDSLLNSYRTQIGQIFFISKNFTLSEAASHAGFSSTETFQYWQQKIYG